AETRSADIADYHQARIDSAQRSPGTYRPSAEDASYSTRDEFDRASAGWPRDFTPERAQASAGQAGAGSSGNIYEAAAKHLAASGTRGSKPVIAAYTAGSRARSVSSSGEAGKTAPASAESWQEASGIAASGRPVAVVSPSEQGFANAESESSTEQDILGDRLVRRKKKRKDADAFSAELSALNPGDLVVHMDHGIGRYEGSEAIKVGDSPHDCVQLTYAGG
ncbi:hypothetical protein OY671_008832, partial [Metschnikowia pulcherrima]